VPIKSTIQLIEFPFHCYLIDFIVLQVNNRNQNCQSMSLLGMLLWLFKGVFIRISLIKGLLRALIRSRLNKQYEKKHHQHNQRYKQQYDH